MNPIDHPHGGGEGRTSGGRTPVTPWGKDTKGRRTRDKNKASQRLIVRSRHAKKEKGAETCRVPSGKGPFVDSYVLKKAEKVPRVGPQRGHQDLVAPLHPSFPQFVGLTFGV